MELKPKGAVRETAPLSLAASQSPATPAPGLPSMTLMDRLKAQAVRCKADVLALYLVARDPRTPWLAKAVIAGVVAYALSPVDLIPDFIPIIGYLDDLILIPLGVALAIRLTPRDIIDECREAARQGFTSGKPQSWMAAGIIVSLWLITAWALLTWFRQDLPTG